MSPPSASDVLPGPAAVWRVTAVPRNDGLTRAQYRSVVAAIVMAHVGAIWAVLQVPAVRATVIEAAPIFVNLLAPPTPVPPPPAPPPPPVVKPLPKEPPRTLIKARPSPQPVPFEAPAPVEAPPPPAVPVLVEAPPAPVAPPAPPPPPPQIPASDVQYLVRPAPEYPRMSIRMGESGQVTVSVYIDEAGLPRTVQVQQSSGHARLDESAVAAVRNARFKPYIRNGVPTAGWARIPIPFELER